jgi:hypothetical protein
MKTYVKNEEFNKLLASADKEIGEILAATSLTAMFIKHNENDTDEFFLALAKILEEYAEMTKQA